MFGEGWVKHQTRWLVGEGRALFSKCVTWLRYYSILGPLCWESAGHQWFWVFWKIFKNSQNVTQFCKQGIIFCYIFPFVNIKNWQVAIEKYFFVFLGWGCHHIHVLLATCSEVLWKRIASWVESCQRLLATDFPSGKWNKKKKKTACHPLCYSEVLGTLYFNIS